jgi:hypothetical protein
MKPIILKAILVFALFSVTYFIQGQVKQSSQPAITTPGALKPFKVLTNGKQITVQTKQNLKSLMVWTASGPLTRIRLLYLLKRRFSL